MPVYNVIHTLEFEVDSADSTSAEQKSFDLLARLNEIDIVPDRWNLEVELLENDND